MRERHLALIEDAYDEVMYKCRKFRPHPSDRAGASLEAPNSGGDVKVTKFIVVNREPPFVFFHFLFCHAKAKVRT